MDEVFDSKVVTASLGDGATIAIEARDPEGIEEDVGILRDRVHSFEGVESSIAAVSQRVIDAVKSAKPTKATVEFGVDVKLEQGALTGLLAKAGGGANLKVTVEWDSAKPQG